MIVNIIERALIAVCGASVIAIIAIYATGCTDTQVTRAENATHIAATAACIVANAFLPDDEAIAKACAIEPALFYLIHPTAAETRTTVGLALARRSNR